MPVEERVENCYNPPMSKDEEIEYLRQENSGLDGLSWRM